MKSQFFWASLQEFLLKFGSEFREGCFLGSSWKKLDLTYRTYGFSGKKWGAWYLRSHLRSVGFAGLRLKWLKSNVSQMELEDLRQGTKHMGFREDVEGTLTIDFKSTVPVHHSAKCLRSSQKLAIHFDWFTMRLIPRWETWPNPKINIWCYVYQFKQFIKFISGLTFCTIDGLIIFKAATSPIHISATWTYLAQHFPIYVPSID